MDDSATHSKTPYNEVVDRNVAFTRLAELLPTVRSRYGVRDLAVFGSVARGEASEASDLDMLVDFVGPATFDGYMGLKYFLRGSRSRTDCGMRRNVDEVLACTWTGLDGSSDR
jgi:predicted nucleotidyltransferase